ncbi:uncharacterized protein UBRO_04551 [Ustilago bromivora]|uniref:Uncharacterized protein n=1 Tax=Ustilago bromivora TaxID=307758 RepID=A0A1K0GQV4_9BASI|nr:uncharacterized protein UBRO_04551 [Ustilago bromivora]SYW82392.1 uncharacterized protein UBRO2_04514 [Ustilago bromivora]
MPSTAPNRSSAASLSPFGKNSQNAALLAKAGKSGTPPPSSSGSTSRQAPSTPKGLKSSALGNGSGGGGGGGEGSRSISLSGSSRSSPAAPNRYTSPPTPGGSGGSILPAASSSMYDSTGLLSRDFETTYHRQCRTLLLAFAAAARMWEEIAIFDGLKWAKEAVEGWEDVQAANELGQRDAGSTRKAKGPASIRPKAQDKRRAIALDPKQAHDPILGPGGLRESRLADASKRIEAAHDGLTTVLDRLTKALNKLTTASDSLRSLLEEATQRKGLEFAFQEPLWATWSLDRFIERTSELASQYCVSTQHLQLLVPTLIHSGEPPASASSRNSEGAAERRSKERRGAYEAWISLPYIETRGSQSLLGFESICEVEVGRWRE